MTCVPTCIVDTNRMRMVTVPARGSRTKIVVVTSPGVLVLSLDDNVTKRMVMATIGA